MNDVTLKIINPIKNLNRVKEILLQINPDKGEKYIEQMLIQMSTFKNFVCFGLFENDKIIGISSGWTSIRIYCGKQL